MISLPSTLIKEGKALGKLAQFLDEAMFQDDLSDSLAQNHKSRHINIASSRHLAVVIRCASFLTSLLHTNTLPKVVFKEEKRSISAILLIVS